jgi:hypothetical protein
LLRKNLSYVFICFIAMQNNILLLSSIGALSFREIAPQSMTG